MTRFLIFLCMIIGKKSVMIAALLATVGAGAIGVGTTFAAGKVTPHDRMTSLVSAIVTKFNLSTTDVQSVFDAQHATNMAARKQNALDHLAKAVADGKITQVQSTALQTKIESEKAFMASLKTMTPEQREAAVKAERASLEQWAKDNGIPKGFARLLPLIGPVEHHMHMRHDRMEDRAEAKR